MEIVYLVIAWCFLIGTLLSIVNFCTKGFQQVRRLHSIPCSNCQYFTDSRYLKCTVNPDLACSEDAINCRDFTPLSYHSRLERFQKRPFVHTL
jgi:hypothetical protein